MADINIERKRRSAWPWVLALLLVLAIAAAAWWFLVYNKGDVQNPMADEASDTTPAATYDPATAPPYPATPADSAAPRDTSAR